MWGESFNAINRASGNPVVQKLFGGITDQLKNTVFKQMMAADQAVDEAEQQLVETIMTQRESGANDLVAALDKNKATTEKIQNKIDTAQNAGERVSAEMYDSLAESYEAEQEKNTRLADFYQRLATISKGTYRTQFQEKSNRYREAALNSQTSADEARRQYDTDQLAEYQHAYEDLQTAATNTENKLTDAEMRHKKVSEKMYADLIKNGNDQIRNL